MSEEIISAFITLLPQHKADLLIHHNPHLAYYQTVAQYVDDPSTFCGTWASEEDRAQAIVKNELWEIQWYPDSPVGFCKVSAASLRAALIKACEP